LTPAADPAAEAEAALSRAEEATGRLDVDGMVAHLSTAIRGFTAAGDSVRAAMICVRLGDVLANAMGNLTAGRAWFARARRLVADAPPCVEQGWVAVAAMGCDVDDPDELLAAAELALDRARRFGDVNLETKALADGGLAHVQAGRVAAGMAMLDEAMALACGPADDTDVTAKSVCSFFTACYHSADFDRASTWAALFRRHGLISQAAPGPAFLSSHCDSVQATLLLELGRWGEAEEVLVRAKAAFESVMPTPAWHPDLALADLRIRQDRLAEADALLLGKDQSIQALLPTAALHLARGDHDLARAAAHRGLRALGPDRLRTTELLAVLVDAELQRGDLDAATAACAELVRRAHGLDIPAVRARTVPAQARALAATGDRAGAIELLQTAADSLGTGLPWRRATMLVELARMRADAGDGAAARLDARAAAAALADLDVVVGAGDAAVLASLGASLRDAAIPGGAGSAPPAAGPGPATLGRDGTWWVAAHGGSSVRLRDTKGLRYLAELVARPGVEQHALDLVDRIEGIAADGGPDRRALGDAGHVLDGRARAAYRRRIEELRGQADEALAAGDLDGAEATQGELDQLVAELARAFGLGGRDRRAASAAERARLNVTRALRAATARLAEALPGAGDALDRSVRTGTYSAYEPAGDDLRWIVRSGVNDERRP
jgi:hypothetical protein